MTVNGVVHFTTEGANQCFVTNVRYAKNLTISLMSAEAKLRQLDAWKQDQTLTVVI